MHPIILALVLGGLAVPTLPDGVAAQEVFDLVPLAPGVYAAEVVDRPPVYAFANSLAGLGASVYLAGHGPTVRDSSLLEEYCDFFDVVVCGAGRS